MTLNNTQYNTIIHAYEERQTKNRHILESRRADVYANVDGYRELDESIASISVEQGKKLLSGDDGQQNKPLDSCRFPCRLPGTHL